MDLAHKGQSPKVLFIGCADSRITPSLMTQSQPGDLFILRNVGNFVAPYKVDEDFHAMAAGIEYAVSVLKVSEIIICGHTHCGACEALYKEIDDPDLIHTKTWLTLGRRAKKLAITSLGPDAPHEALLRQTEKISVVTQVEHLLTYPAVRRGGQEQDTDDSRLDVRHRDGCHQLLRSGEL